MNGRAEYNDDKREIVERLYHAWRRAPELRLSQLLENSYDGLVDVFYIEDYNLVDGVEDFVKRYYQ